MTRHIHIHVKDEKSAKDLYKARINEARNLLRQIERGLNSGEKRFESSGSTNWAYVGDLARIVESLKEAERLAR